MNAHLALVLNIESQPAIDNLDEILKIPDIDCLLVTSQYVLPYIVIIPLYGQVGPHDLSCNLGIPEQFEHPKFKAALKTIFEKARAAGAIPSLFVYCMVLYGTVY